MVEQEISEPTRSDCQRPRPQPPAAAFIAYRLTSGNDPVARVTSVNRWRVRSWFRTRRRTSSLSSGDLYFSLAGFVGFYTLLLVVELYLMFKYARLGPSSLATGRYHFESAPAAAPGRGA